MKPTLIKFPTVDLTFTPQTPISLAGHLHDFASGVQRKHRGLTDTFDLDALTDLRELADAERYLAKSLSALSNEQKAVDAAINILRGDSVDYYGDHPLPAQAERIVKESRLLGSIDPELSLLDHSLEISSLEELRDELNTASREYETHGRRALKAVQQARLLAFARCKDVHAATALLEGINWPFPADTESVIDLYPPNVYGKATFNPDQPPEHPNRRASELLEQVRRAIATDNRRSAAKKSNQERKRGEVAMLQLKESA